ncbi:unnamed protein product [Caenorhabditis auriculariae]|uniref:Palmitoyltransferase n=1 Tax=Caenorhabditis auriculariae TaxID=2777116 RepID=A0A8S1GNF8_9PELO|nr:unnamed protein product [Caenorhabditis auriculariae]
MGVGKALVYVVFSLTLFLSFTSFFIILPYEQLYKSPYLLIIISIFGLYLLINIQFHYYKARTLPPVANPGAEGDSFCEKCNYWKSTKTHHCAVCGKCILGMDHHCIWINQCVGSHNHRHFFLFIASLTLATLIILMAGFNSFYDHVFNYSTDYTFCSANLHMAPLQPFICEYDGFARNAVIFCYLLSAVLFLMVGGLTLWNVYLISIGCTYIDYLQKNGTKRPSGYRKYTSKAANWRNFLGLRRNRTFLKYVLLPRVFPPILYENIRRTESDSSQIV